MFQPSEIDGKQLRYNPERMQKQAHSGHFDMGLESGVAYWRSVARAQGRPFEITFSDDKVIWKEEGLFSITGMVLNPASSGKAGVKL